MTCEKVGFSEKARHKRIKIDNGLRMADLSLIAEKKMCFILFLTLFR